MCKPVVISVFLMTMAAGDAAPTSAAHRSSPIMAQEGLTPMRGSVDRPTPPPRVLDRVFGRVNLGIRPGDDRRYGYDPATVPGKLGVMSPPSQTWGKPPPKATKRIRCSNDGDCGQRASKPAVSEGPRPQPVAGRMGTVETRREELRWEALEQRPSLRPVQIER
jgi:hypothetical protein